MPEHDGWEYESKPPPEGDCRKLVTLQDGSMCWVGIRAYHHAGAYWLNGGEPERAKVLAWRDLAEPARGRWSGGKLILSTRAA